MTDISEAGRSAMTKKNEARRETLANPFRRKRRANGSARYLNKREEQEHRGKYDRAGNRNW